MRPGVIISIIGHIGFVLMTMLAWDASSNSIPTAGAVVPVEIVATAPESNVRALAVDVPDEEVSPDEEQPAEAEERPTPASTATPRREQRRDEFDLDAIAGMIDRQRDTGPRRREGERAERNQQGAGLGTAEVAAIADRARSLVARQMARCWRMPVDLPDPERLIVTVEFELDRNGNLRGQPRVTSPTNYTFDAPMRTAAEAALRAVRSCDFTFLPEDPVVGPQYDVWKEQRYTFRPPT